MVHALSFIQFSSYSPFLNAFIVFFTLPERPQYFCQDHKQLTSSPKTDPVGVRESFWAAGPERILLDESETTYGGSDHYEVASSIGNHVADGLEIHRDKGSLQSNNQRLEISFANDSQTQQSD